MAKSTPIKLNTQQLRSLIAEELKRSRLAEADDKFDIAGEHAEFLGQAIYDAIAEDDDTVVSNAWEMMIGTVGEDNLSVPGRIEDLPHWAEKIADIVLKNSEFRELVVRLAMQVLESSVDNFGSPGPGES